jgi:hypothetical protein
VRATLTTLTIEAENVAYPGFDLVPITTQGSRRLLRDFSNLKTLTCPQFFLLGFPASLTDRLGDTLPINIKHFTINDDMSFMNDMEFYDKALLQALRDWLTSPRSTTPHIRSFNLSLRQSDIEWGPAMRQEVRDLCAKAGLDVGIAKLDEDMVSIFAEEEAALPPSTWEYRWL